MLFHWEFLWGGVCTLIDDRGMYASFGQEIQYGCTKFVTTFTPSYKTLKGTFLGRIDFAPIYKFIKYKAHTTPEIYGKDSKGRPIDGGNVYVDWYKNLNTQLYDLQDAPIINAYLQYQWDTPQFWTVFIRIGRMVDLIGMDEKNFFWQDNGKFSPYSYFLTKQLLSGTMIRTELLYFKAFSIDTGMGIYFGGNPAVDGSIVCANMSPSEKNNNTPIMEGKIGTRIPFMHTWSLRTFVSGKLTTDGSTYNSAQKCGKSRRNIYVGNVQLQWNPISYMSFILLSQTTYWTSGLTPKSSQNDGSAKFHTFHQLAQTYGMWTHWWRFGLGVSYEIFPRMDGQVFNALQYKSIPSLGNVQDWIFHIQYAINPLISLFSDVMILKNPAEFASNILDTAGDNRYEMGIQIQTLGF